jgi:hypothetical protein
MEAMRRPRHFLLWVLASLIVCMASSPGFAGSVIYAHQILDTLGVRPDQPLGAPAQPGTVIKGAVVSPKRLARHGFPGVSQGATVVIRVTGKQMFLVELPQYKFSKKFSVDDQGKLMQ